MCSHTLWVPYFCIPRHFSGITLLGNHLFWQFILLAIIIWGLIWGDQTFTKKGVAFLTREPGFFACASSQWFSNSTVESGSADTLQGLGMREGHTPSDQKDPSHRFWSNHYLSPFPQVLLDHSFRAIQILQGICLHMKPNLLWTMETVRLLRKPTHSVS